MHMKMVSNNTLQTMANSTNVAPSRFAARRAGTRHGRDGVRTAEALVDRIIGAMPTLDS
ncbi:hypothetical protein RBWH47_04372 [Rhodopirellula baltica WH47]|uniref:Uncharacterized protein n=1 Tax=Rhodopirellula baltica WH47 TaxID=991778 RepID=F2ARV9_RHOBT|nr:hypothetical protein RBWH47_04372 [Rhodopirellula baltica WH47]